MYCVASMRQALNIGDNNNLKDVNDNDDDKGNSEDLPNVIRLKTSYYTTKG